MKLTAQEIYDKLINEEQIKTVKGQIRFHLGDVMVNEWLRSNFS